jgi:hypothetical protein
MTRGQPCHQATATLSRRAFSLSNNTYRRGRPRRELDDGDSNAAGRPLRARAEQAIENLIGLLDDLDGGPDLEGTHHGHGYGTTSEDDEPDDTGITDQDGLTEQTVGHWAASTAGNRAKHWDDPRPDVVASAD